MLKSPWDQKCPSVVAEPDKVSIRIAGEVTDILEVNLPQWLAPLDPLHIWTDKFIDQKYNYRPDNPLYLLLVRIYKLKNPLVVDKHPGIRRLQELGASEETRLMSPARRPCWKTTTTWRFVPRFWIDKSGFARQDRTDALI